MKKQILGLVSGGENLSTDQMSGAIGQIMQGEWQDEEIALLLTALHTKGETIDEIAGAALAMREHMTPITSSRHGLLDTCGTGGDASGTFNISTAAALVTAAAGIAVAKHGNRSITSKTGSADVLQQLGVNVEASVAQAERCLDELGICFCFAPLLHQSMKHVAQVRRSLSFPTIFNLLGPLCNPAHAQFQLLGVGRPELRPTMAAVLSRLQTKRSVVVCGEDGLDEVTLRGRSNCTLSTVDGISQFSWVPEDFGLTTTDDYSSMMVTGPADSASVILDVLRGVPGPSRDIVVLNAAAALWTAEYADTPTECAKIAAQVLDAGVVLQLLERLKTVSNEPV